MMRQSIVILTFLFLFLDRSFAQEKKEPAFFETISDDSVMIFFNRDYKATEKNCADYFRFIRVNERGDFDGFFVDVFNDKNYPIVGRGQYSNGEKDGLFETFSTTGRVLSRGSYSKNLPIGRWEFFYENGLPERTLDITANDTLLTTFVDRKGNKNISEGRGMFSGRVYGMVNEDEGQVVASGDISNGKPEGKWVSTYNKSVLCVEKFKNGKFLKGNFPNAAKDNHYSKKSYLQSFFPPSYFDKLNTNEFKKCGDGQLVVPRYGSRNFERQLLNQLALTPIPNLIIGDNYFSFRFFVNEASEPVNFSAVGRGVVLINTLRIAIKKYMELPASAGEVYFHLRVYHDDLPRTDDELFYEFSRDVQMHADTRILFR
jgi:antitoxin component YwqK of YwqJK toxin-antitoxin module